MNPREQLLAEIPATESRYRLAGMSTAVLEGGDGPPLVLLHGPGEFAAKWLRVVPDLVRTHRVVAPDLPGHGDTGMPDGELDVARVLTWLDELIEQTCPEPPVVVGHVIGGAIAARFASEHSDRLGGLVLVDTLGLTPFQPAPSFGEAMTEFLAQPDEDTYERFMRLCSHDLDRLREEMGDLWAPYERLNIDGARDPVAKAALGTLIGQFGFPEIPSEELARITVPTVLIWGREDLATPVAVAEAASERHGWPLHVIDGVADDPPRDAPEEFVKALNAALTTRIKEVA
jgi:pimeloyl-ACP methyl ester carboxylesterase